MSEPSIIVRQNEGVLDPYEPAYVHLYFLPGPYIQGREQHHF